MLPVARLAYKTVGALNAALRHWVVLHSVAHVKREVPQCLRVIEPLSGNTKLAHGRSRSGSLAIFAAVVAKSGMRRLPHSLTRGCGLQPTDERGYSRIIL